MAIEAVSGIQGGAQAEALRQTQASASPQVFHADQVPTSEAADAFRETIGKVHDELNKFSPEAGQNHVKADPVEAAKNDILPSPWKTGGADAATKTASATAPASATNAPAAPQTSADGNNVLRKSFDHAIYVTLVSQVIGGVSQATSTLIKQQ